MNSLLVVVKSHLFLSNEIAITSSGERDEVAADNRGGRAWHSGEKWGSGSQSRWADNPSEARGRQLLTTPTHDRHLVDGARLGIG